MRKKRRARLPVLSLALLVLGLAFFGFFKIFIEMPDFTVLRDQAEVKIRLANGERSVRKVGPKAAGWVKFTNISDSVILAVIAAEDTTFFQHKGVDLHEIKQAIRTDIKERRFARGASTITQQLVKNVFLTHEKTLWRKIREFFWAKELEKVISKTEILGFYLNMVEWGPGIYGIGEASQHFFQLPPARLTAKQSAYLAMLLPSPRKYYRYFKERKLTEWADKRVKSILRVMHRMRFINEPTFEIALEEPLWDTPY